MYSLFWSSTGYQKSQYDAVLSAHHLFAAPIPPGRLWGR
jgi:hypothetical protein